MKYLIGGIIVVVVCSISLNVFAEWQEPRFEIEETFRLSGDDDDNWMKNRLAAFFTFADDEGFDIVISPFVEFDYNTDLETMERTEWGAEFGSQILKYLYLGLGIQYVEQDYDWSKYRGWLPQVEYTTELEPRLLFEYPLLEIDGRQLIGFILDEYTVDLRMMAGVRNEAVIGVQYPILDNLTAKVNWRHIDRIHDYDSETVEFGGIINF
ncbi:hypothetical protein ACFL1E_04430 [Candidatus Omnitrophota bacterium]